MSEDLKAEPSRKERIDIVNKIIIEISTKGRNFFHNEGLTAKIVDKKGKIFYKAEYGKKKFICLSVPPYNKPSGWFHGGTLLRLVYEFKSYIQKGVPKDEYSGLFSPHWAYPENDMEAIREKAFQLGYLKK